MDAATEPVAEGTARPFWETGGWEGLRAKLPAGHRSGHRRGENDRDGWRRASEITEHKVAWLWQGRLAFGAVAVLAGDGGLGKSTIAAELAARASLGQGLPGGPSVEPADVLILSAEDDASSVLIPRLRLAEADLVRVHLWDDRAGELRFPEHVDELRTRIEATGAKLVVIDPGPAFMAGDASTNGERDIRGFLRPLRAIAEEAGACILVLAHLRKGEGSAGDRVLGGVAWRNAPRLVLVLGRHPEAESPADPRRVLAVDKTNYGRVPRSMLLTIDARDGEDHPTVGWIGETDVSADEAVRRPDDPGTRAEVHDAREAIADVLANGEVEAGEFARRVRDLGVGDNRFREARSAMRRAGLIEHRQERGEGRRGGGGQVLWSLADRVASPPGSPPMQPGAMQPGNPAPDTGSRADRRPGCMASPTPMQPMQPGDETVADDDLERSEGMVE